ncbi:MAG TPA: ABC transporter permease subunit [Isosphaeraceae bacterium]|jgi:ABC-type transport system involved in multi-copper enzyme maturation permease subunit|nr:ABC transporter permease subunit [Isosphaeraceae bacterium]
MTATTAAAALGWLVRDTFRQARASRLAWLMLAVSALCILLCLSLRIDGSKSVHRPGEIELVAPDEQPLHEPGMRLGRVSLLFGAVRLGVFRDAEAQVHFLQVLLAEWVAGAAGTLLALVWTAGFLPEFLRPDAAAVLLAKPVRRRTLLLGKSLGVLAFVAFQAVLFIGGTWLALGVRTGVWRPGYLWSIPLLTLHFALVYAASVLLAVCSRSTVVAAFGSIVFWALCFGLNFGRHAAVALAATRHGVIGQARGFGRAVEAIYWVLPKPADLMILLDRAVLARDHFAAPAEFEAVQRLGAFHPALSVLSSALFAVALLAVAARELELTDY